MKTPFSQRGQVQLITVGVIAGLLLLAFMFCTRTVDTGQVGVVTMFGKVTGEVLEEGLHIINPVKTVTSLNLRVVNTTERTECFSKDLQVVTITYTLLTRLPKENAINVFQNIGLDYVGRVIMPRIQEVVKQQTAAYNAENLISNRNEIRLAIVKGVRDRLSGVVDIEDFAISNVNFSKEYEKAIEEKQVAAQQALRAENELQRAKIDAMKRIAEAEGEAKAIQVRGEALSRNPAVVQLEAIQKWNGVSPQSVMLSGEFANKLPVVFPIK
jgi:prohibitin 2